MHALKYGQSYLSPPEAAMCVKQDLKSPTEIKSKFRRRMHYHALHCLAAPNVYDICCRPKRVFMSKFIVSVCPCVGL